MSLVRCFECGAQISTDAVSCPKCGARGPRRDTVLAFLVLVLIVVGIVAAYGFYVRKAADDDAATLRRSVDAYKVQRDMAREARWGW